MRLTIKSEKDLIEKPRSSKLEAKLMMSLEEANTKYSQEYKVPETSLQRNHGKDKK